MSYHNVPVRERTWVRLQAYRMLSPNYDALLNRLMDSLPLDVLSKETLAEVERRLASFDGIPLRDAKGLKRRGRRNT